MALPNDVSRCINDNCSKKEQCARFMDWPLKNYPSVPVSTFNQDENNNCENFIKYGS